MSPGAAVSGGSVGGGEGGAYHVVYHGGDGFAFVTVAGAGRGKEWGEDEELHEYREDGGVAGVREGLL